MQASEQMGDARHKKSPPPSEFEEPVTEAFRAEALRALKANKESNRLRGLKRDDPRYLISNQSELAAAIKADKNEIRKLLGGVRATTKVKKLTARSVWVAPIREVLDLSPVTTISVHAKRAAILSFIDGLSDEDFRAFEMVISERMARLAS